MAVELRRDASYSQLDTSQARWRETLTELIMWRDSERGDFCMDKFAGPDFDVREFEQHGRSGRLARRHFLAFRQAVHLDVDDNCL